VDFNDLDVTTTASLSDLNGQTEDETHIRYGALVRA